MSDWNDLARECDAWAEAGLAATWWWRDDDAVDHRPALDTLLDLQPASLALAVIPAILEQGLVECLRRHPGIAVLQHGFAHLNHAPADQHKSEFPDSRDAGAMAADLGEGFRRLQESFGQQFLPVLTPPWNRMGEIGTSLLKPQGFTGLSRSRPRKATTIHGVSMVNIHVDVIDWLGSQGFLGEASCLDLFTNHLQARRLGGVDRNEPTGLLTHHLVHDPATWRFLEKLRDFLAKQPAARLLDPAAAFGLGAVSG